jgi:hypothetical protein
MNVLSVNDGNKIVWVSLHRLVDHLVVENFYTSLYMSKYYAEYFYAKNILQSPSSGHTSKDN